MKIHASMLGCENILALKPSPPSKHSILASLDRWHLSSHNGRGVKRGFCSPPNDGEKERERERERKGCFINGAIAKRFASPSSTVQGGKRQDKKQAFPSTSMA